MENTTITYVSAFIDLGEDRSRDRSAETRINLFKKLATSGIAICLFVCSKNEQIGIELQNEFSNVKLMPILNLEDTETYKLIMSFNPQLPILRTDYHDTLKFLILMNTKSEFVYKVILQNPFNTEYFAWIDFSIYHILLDIELSIKNISSRLYLFGNSKLNVNLEEEFILFPSCWTPETSKHIINNTSNSMTNSISKSVNWRFCGGFFLGNKKAIENMHFLIQKELPNFIQHTGSNIIAWEVNVWAWLECKCNWQPKYYMADHNETMLNIPLEYMINSILEDNRISNITSNIIKYIDKVIYINLDHRIDRKNEIESELNNFNIPYERFSAICNKGFGIVGCTKSHLEVIKIAKANKYKNILIFEDDFKFIVSREEFEKNIELLFENIQFDVCMLSYNLIKYEEVDGISFLIKALEVQTASGYIVNETMYDKLINLYEYAIPLLESTQKHWIYANDQIWKRLQPTSNWYCFKTRLGLQRPSYSDNGESWCDLKC